ncbi:MAG: hypothetical protein DRI84_05535 [Bacteroidetes bacterium]|nr:MAG: hypothetical protein DRI84_05535 [Bacteroidota bacterium]
MKKFFGYILISLILVLPIIGLSSSHDDALPAAIISNQQTIKHEDHIHKYSPEDNAWIISEPEQVIPKHISGVTLVLILLSAAGIIVSVILNKVIEAKTKEVRDTKNRFKSLFDQAPLSYQSINKDGIIIEVNKTWLDIMGYVKNEVIDHRFSKFLHPNDVETFEFLFPKLKAVGEILGEEFEMKKKDGGYITVAFHGKIAYDSKNKFKQTHCVFRDITEQKIIASKLSHARKMESIGTLAAGISHDFNNILFIIMSSVQLMLLNIDKEDKNHRLLTNIMSAGDRGTQLIKQILAFSRQSQKRIVDTDIKPIVREALILSATMPENIEVTSDIDSSDNYIVQADPTQIHQVVLNLITNAYHAVEINEGSVSVELKKVHLADTNLLGEELLPGNYVRLTVSDQGIGMNTKTLENIFDPYFTTKDKGTGLGLSVVYGIVTEYKGDIKVYSELDEGTIFSVYLPLVDQSNLE